MCRSKFLLALLVVAVVHVSWGIERLGNRSQVANTSADGATGEPQPDDMLLGGFRKKTYVKMPTKISPSADHIFLSSIKIGPKKRDQFKMIVDISSSEMLVMSDLMNPYKKKNRAQKKRLSTPPDDEDFPEKEERWRCERQYQPGRNTYYRYNDNVNMKPVVLGYSDGSTYKGNTCGDTVDIGPMSVDMDFFGVSEMNSAATCLRGRDYDGVLGLALTKPNGADAGGVANRWGDKLKPPPLMLKNMIGKKKHMQPVFSFYIDPASEGRAGQVVFGGIDKTLHYGEMEFFPTELYSFHGEVTDWRLKFNTLAIGAQPLGLSRMGFVARFETTLKYGIYAPPGSMVTDDILRITPHSERLGDGTVVVPCHTRVDLPNLDLYIGETMFSFAPQEYFPFRGSLTSEKLNSPKFVAGKYCELFVVDRYQGGVNQPPDSGLYAIGIPFMKKYHTAYDARGKIGIAPYVKPVKKKGRSWIMRMLAKLWPKKKPEVRYKWYQERPTLHPFYDRKYIQKEEKRMNAKGWWPWSKKKKPKTGNEFEDDPRFREATQPPAPNRSGVDNDSSGDVPDDDEVEWWKDEDNGPTQGGGGGAAGGGGGSGDSGGNSGQKPQEEGRRAPWKKIWEE